MLMVRVEPPPPPAALVQVVPLEVRTLPVVPGATNSGALVPLPKMTLLAVRFARLVPPLAIGRVPVTPVVNGRPVALVRMALAGVPRAGVTSVGLVDKTTLPVPVEVVTPVPPCATVTVAACLINLPVVPSTAARFVQSAETTRKVRLCSPRRDPG